MTAGTGSQGMTSQSGGADATGAAGRSVHAVPSPRSDQAGNVPELPGRPLGDLLGLLRSGELGVVELVTACLEAIEAWEEQLRAWVHLDPDHAMAQARRLDALPADERGPLHGVPVGIKDIIDTADLPTSYGSPIYAGHRPSEDAAAVARLRAAGAVILGKTVTTEFALFQAGATTNPHDPSRTPGGSSSGSAAAVAAGTVPLAVGTQTAGSVVRPASFCGVVGVKPTYGRVAATGVKECSRSLDTVGTFTRDVAGAASVLSVLAGSEVEPVATEPVRVGFTRTHEWPYLPPEIRTRIEQAVQRIAADHDVVDVTLPDEFAGLIEAQKCIMLVEATQALAVEREQHRGQLSAALREVLAVGDRQTWAYGAALAHVQRCRDALAEVFAPVDVLVAPSVLGEAPPLEQGTGDPLLCRAWTALGTPTIALPGLIGPAGLPLGIQVIAGPGRDDLALEAARQLLPLLPPPSHDHEH